ncbi:lipoprotein [Vallitalea longa]|uniref:Lipoprotein n=1 Tax=Vallitalea longa TaxID=2936439 RepID=A0A9W5YCN1_9FIRM|nr:MqnA/MqnD/SBP family protein [Vallitalea longa]GKX29918.1 lipoprotein [Vallitalea longa]
MKNLSKIVTILLTLVLISTLFVGCKSSKKDVENDKYNQEQEKGEVEDDKSKDDADKEGTDKETDTSENDKEATVIKVAALKGPTGMGMAKLMDDVDSGESALKCEFTLSGAPDELTGKIISNEVDLACVPTNLASVLYNKSKGQIKLAAVNTLGVLYVMEVGDEIKSVEDLKGKEIYTSGKGLVPDYILQYILKENNLDPEKDVTLNYTMQHAEVATTVISGDNKLAMLPQPFVTTVSMKNKDARIALDITEEWKKIQGEDSPLAMGCIIVNSEFAANNKELVADFLEEYKQSVEWVNANAEEAGKVIENQGIINNAKIAETAIPNSNIVFITAEDAKETLQNLYEILFEFNPTSVGGKLPDGDFYYKE